MAHNAPVPHQSQISGNVALAVTRVLSFYPVIGTVLVLSGGLLKFKLLVWLAIASFVFVLYMGSCTWLIFTIYLTRKKRISKKEILLQILTAATGILLAYYTIEFDILDSGAKYID
ncbi:MAG: hypothetical protein WC760_10940 [Bacteroidia bacterium]|jgi:hypothetical protein